MIVFYFLSEEFFLLLASSANNLLFSAGELFFVQFVNKCNVSALN